MSAIRKQSKGELTATRLLDAAENLFADKGYEAASLREIALTAGIQEPGLYNYFRSKEDLYSAVLDRALSPMDSAMQVHLAGQENLQAFTSLPMVMTDLLLAHPQMAALFQQALRGDPDSVGNRLLSSWLDRLFSQGMATMSQMGYQEIDRADMAIQVIALFNLCTGYFLSQRAFESMAEGDITDPDNIERQKKLLSRLQRALLVG
jgi:AcrR family transcriptional regulator